MYSCRPPHRWSAVPLQAHLKKLFPDLGGETRRCQARQLYIKPLSTLRERSRSQRIAVPRWVEQYLVVRREVESIRCCPAVKGRMFLLLLEGAVGGGAGARALDSQRKQRPWFTAPRAAHQNKNKPNQNKDTPPPKQKQIKPEQGQTASSPSSFRAALITPQNKTKVVTPPSSMKSLVSVPGTFLSPHGEGGGGLVFGGHAYVTLVPTVRRYAIPKNH